MNFRKTHYDKDIGEIMFDLENYKIDVFNLEALRFIDKIIDDLANGYEMEINQEEFINQMWLRMDLKYYIKQLKLSEYFYRYSGNENMCNLAYEEIQSLKEKIQSLEIHLTIK